MKLKKLSALLLAGAMTLGLAACTPAAPAASNPPTPSATMPGAAATPAPAPISDLNVGVFYYNYSDVYISSVRANMDEKLTALGVKFQNYDGNSNQANQNDQITTAISNGTNLLIVNIVETSSPDAAQSAVEAARTAGIPIVFFNREVTDDVVASYDKCAFVGTDAPEAGHMQGKMIGEYLIANYDAVDLNGDGTISYVMFKGQEGNNEANFRTLYSVEDADVLLTDGGKSPLSFYDSKNTSKYLVDQSGNWSAQASNDYMKTILAEYSEANGNMIEMVIANNDGMAEGAVSALQDAGYNLGNDEDGKPTSTVIPVFGVDATENAKALINEGKMTGTIKQDAVGMAATICKLVSNIQDGAGLMDNTTDLNVDKNDDGSIKVFKIRVPYGVYTG